MSVRRFLFGPTREERRWAAEARIFSAFVDLGVTAIRAASAIRVAELEARVAELEAQAAAGAGGGPRPAPPALPPRPARVNAGGNGAALPPARQRILNALAFLEGGIGLTWGEKTQVALLADASPTSGSYFNNLGGLRSAGFLDYPSAGLLALTDEGRAHASTDGVPGSVDELHRALERRLPPAKWKLVAELIAAYPKPLAKDDLAGKAGASATSGSYFNNLGSLRSLGLIDYPAPGQVVALPVLFLEGRA